MLRSKSKPEDPTVFRKLTPAIKHFFANRAERICELFMPQIKQHDIVPLCVRAEHVDTLREAKRLCPQLASDSYETACTKLRLDHYVTPEVIVSMRIEQEHTVLMPAYCTAGQYRRIAWDTITGNPSAPPELVEQFKSDLTTVFDLLGGLSLAAHVFDRLNADVANCSRSRMRYVFPSILQILRWISKNNHDKKLREEAANYSGSLAVVGAGQFYPVDISMREALSKATGAMSHLVLLDSAETPPRDTPIDWLVQSMKFDHPTMPGVTLLK